MCEKLRIGVEIIIDDKLRQKLEDNGRTDNDIDELNDILFDAGYWDKEDWDPLVGDYFSFVDIFYDILTKKLDEEGWNLLRSISWCNTVVVKRVMLDRKHMVLKLKIDPDEDNIAISNKNPLLDIKFNGAWKPSKKFNEIFELVNDDGDIVERAGVKISKYRFKIGMENWGKTTWVAGLFERCVYNLENITLPESWGNVIDVSGMFKGCYGLKCVTLPNNWGNVTISEGMFEGCDNLKVIMLPKDWGNINEGKTMKRRKWGEERKIQYIYHE